MATAQPETLVTGHDGAVTALAVDLTDGLVYSGGEDGQVIAWQLETLTPTPLAAGPAVTGLLTVRPGVFATTRADGLVRLGGTVEPRSVGGLGSPTLALDGPMLYVTDSNGLVHRLNGVNLEQVAPPLSFPGATRVAAHDGVLAVADADGGLTVAGEEFRWRANASERGLVNALAVLDAGQVVTGGGDGLVRAWAGAEEFDALAGGAPVTSLDAQIVGGERVVASGHLDGKLQVVFGDKQRIVTFETGTDPVAAVALVVREGRLVVLTGGADGRIHMRDLEALGATPAADKVEWLTDAPAEEDLLRRRPLARALARRLERIREGEPGRSFLIHVDGAWGTGKSTILSYLGEELTDRWLVVDFNAWRHSRVGPPWWALLVSLRGAVARERGSLGRIGLRLQEALTQARRTGTRYLIALAVAAAVAAALYVLLKPGDTTSIGDTARSLAAVLAGLGTLWAAGTVVARMMLWDSAKGAKVYEQAESDPMEHVAQHFAWLADRAGRPILFFVDDLDRCPGDYVVDLLEAVQTLVRDAPGGHGTYFVVAADGSWVRTSYEHRYADFAGSVGEPGRPLGYLFLDKLFQLTVRVPAVSALDQAHYLAGLLAVERQEPDVQAEVASAQEKMQAGRSDADVVAALGEASPAAREVLRETAIERLSDPTVQAATEHALERFAELLEPNPRAMKRFVNAFGLARVVLTLEDVLVPFDVLALWTILSTRWPMLADRLREHPEEVELAGDAAAQAPGLPDDVRALLASREVAEVTRFPDGGPLTRALVEECVTGRASTAAPAR
jgi:hypothetical protein